MSDSVRSHRQQPTRLPHPWDSPGKNTGLGRHFLLLCMKVKSESEVAQSCPTLSDPWTAAHQAPPSMGFSRGEDWSGVPLPSPGDAALSSNKTWDWKQETEPCFPMYLLGSPICCVNLIKFHHLSGGVKVGVSLQEVRMVLL